MEYFANFFGGDADFGAPAGGVFHDEMSLPGGVFEDLKHSGGNSVITFLWGGVFVGSNVVDESLGIKRIGDFKVCCEVFN